MLLAAKDLIERSFSCLPMYRSRILKPSSRLRAVFSLVSFQSTSSSSTRSNTASASLPKRLACKKLANSSSSTGSRGLSEIFLMKVRNSM